jgi:hypothetical protein
MLLCVSIGAAGSIRRCREEPDGAISKHSIHVEKNDFDFLRAVGRHDEILTGSI